MPSTDDRDDETQGPVVVAIQRAVGAELRRDLHGVRHDVDRLEVRVDTHDEHISDLRENHARIDGEVRHLVRSYERSYEQSASVANAQVLADLDIRKATELARLKEAAAIAADRRETRRELLYKLIAFLIGLGTLLASAIVAKR